jgi:putative ABC transport system permease protein
MRGIREDIRYALRKIRREPAFFVFAALIIALGVGANTAVYSVMSPLVIRPLPFHDPDRLVWVAHEKEGGLSSVTSRTSNLRDYREMTRTFESLTGYMAFFDYGSYTMTGDADPQRLVGVGIAQNFLDVLGVDPLLGRSFSDEESVSGGRPAALLTYDFWQRRFASNPGIVGQSVTLNGTPTEIVGVMPATFDFASTFVPASHVDFMVPFPIDDQTDRWGNTLAIIGRTRPGVSVAAAQADLDGVTELLRANQPDRWGLGTYVTSLRDHIAGEQRSAMLLLALAACGVMLVACANLSNLLLARGRSRNREMAVRSALGANRRRIFRQLFIESLVLAVAGGTLGVGLAWLITSSVAHTTAVSIPLLRTVSLDGGTLLFALAVTLAAGFLVGVAPVLQVATGREAQAMRDSGRGSTEGRRGNAIREALVVGEVATACVLLVGSGLLLRSFVSVLDVDLGFQPAGAVEWRVDTIRQFETLGSATAFYDDIVNRVAALPGVQAAGLTDTPPLGRNREWGLGAQGVAYENNTYPSAFPRLVDSRYLDAMRIPLLSGRMFTPFDNADSKPVMILNETAAKNVFGGEDAIGRTALINGSPFEVIGIVQDVRHQSLEKQAGNEMYLPYTQVTGGFSALTLVVRSSLPLPSLVDEVKPVLREADATLPVDDYRTLDSVVDQAVSPRRFVLTLLGGFAGIALLLAALGIYAVLSYTVTQRIPEIGIRMALGESAAQVRWRVVSRTLLLAGLGLLCGAMLAAVAARIMRSLLFDVAPADPLTFAAMAAVLLVVAGLAGFLPALRASRTDPVVALRSS